MIYARVDACTARVWSANWKNPEPSSASATYTTQIVISKLNPNIHPDFIDVDELWESRVPNYTNDVLVRGHQ